MDAQPPIPVRAGFTLIEVLAARGAKVVLVSRKLEEIGPRAPPRWTPPA